MASFALLIFYWPYMVLRLIIHTARNLLWRINGTHAAILKNTNNYETSAHVLSIIGRFRYDTITTSNKLLDYVLIHKGFEHPKYVLKDEITFYHINDRQAVFVECELGDSPWNMKHYSFSKGGQYHKAIRVIILTLDNAQQLADDVGPPKEDLIFIHNMTRCGSTLLCQMFQETGQYISYGEPSVFQDILPLAGHHSYPWIAKRITMVVSLLCKQTTCNNNVRGHVIKIISSASELLSSIYELFPDGHYLFLYRDVIPTARSAYRAYTSLPGVLIMFLLDCMSHDLGELFKTYHGHTKFNGSIVAYTSKGMYAELCPALILSHVMYQRWRSERKSFAAVKYEDLISDPQGSLEIIFDYCGAPKDLITSALHAMEMDSQGDSILSRRNLLKKSPTFSDDDIKEFQELFNKFSLPDLVNKPVLEGTISKSGIPPSVHADKP